MELDKGFIKSLYQESYEEYNKSELAIGFKYNYIPNNFTLIQLHQIVKYLPNKNPVFVDIGTGMGIAPRFVQKIGARSISLDWPTTGGYEPIKTVMEAGVEGYYCEVGREPIPIEEGSVDVVLLADVIEHLPHSPRPVLNEIYRILKQNGVCIATTPNATRLTVRAKMILGFSNWPSVFDYYEEDFNIGHHHEYTISEFKEVFHRAGFMLEKFILYEKTLRYVDIEGLHDLQTRDRSGEKTVTKSPLMIRLGKSILWLITELLPKLRSEMLIITKKPPITDN